MEKLNITQCPLCGSAHIHAIAKCKDYYASGEEFELYDCDDCGFRFTQGVPVETEIGKYYETPDYISHTDTRKGFMNKIYHHVRSYMLGKKARLVIRVSKKIGGSLLDVGAGTGYFAHEMDLRGWKVTAAEKSEAARSYAQKTFSDLQVIDSADISQLEDKRYDVITMWHVMEHVENINAEWELLSRLLKDRGRLIIAVPNCASADEAIYKTDWAAYDVPRHLWHFTPDTMRRMAEKHHFTLTSLYPMPFDAFYVSMLSEKYRGHKNYFAKGLLNGLKAGVKAYRDIKLSSSVIFVFKKSDKPK